MDICNQLDKLNTFPKDSRYQTFLLDKYNKVVCIGNPTENPQIWSLYKQIINENKRVEKTVVNGNLVYSYNKVDESHRGQELRFKR